MRLTFADQHGSTALTVDIYVLIIQYNPCTQGFRNVPASGEEYQYILRTPETPMAITFAGLDNTECPFEVQMFEEATGAAFTHSVFTL